MITALRSILLHDLDALRTEVEAFPSDASLWTIVPGTSNPPGALALHICGNLQHFVGGVLGRTGYVRHRDAEFAARDRAREEVLAEIERTRRAVDETLAAMSDAEAAAPTVFLDEPTTVGALLVRLSGHLRYHLGQINYSRRITHPASSAH